MNPLGMLLIALLVALLVGWVVAQLGATAGHRDATRPDEEGWRR